jgi:sulfur-carrier protein adenylyltransferase/sulfurtransferase
MILDSELDGNRVPPLGDRGLGHLRYSRQILIPEFGIEGQEKLSKSKVLVIGCGGLGSPVLLYLAAAGVGTLGFIDNDKVDESNLQRQILYGSESIGKMKAEEAKKRLNSLNPLVNLEHYTIQLNASNALEIFKNYDLIIDGTDNFPTRYLVNDACVLLNKPFVYGAIYRFEGQVGVFNYNNSVTYRDLFPTPPTPEMAPNCAEAGVLGMMAGIIGSMQANEAIKIIAQIGEPLVGKIYMIDALSMVSRIFKIPKIPDAPKITELIDYEVFCGIDNGKLIIDNISIQELNEWKEKVIDFQLIDVREPNEYAVWNYGGELMPLAQIEHFIDKIDRKKPVIIHCQSGIRSMKAITLLSEKYKFENLINLQI